MLIIAGAYALLKMENALSKFSSFVKLNKNNI